ncbi:unnamed protein product [marine sediment metagenome]|uniref:Response regulatory domain-containing protein n=1 Tax=marine sediment metagenome TaxID=412755 RepID=X0T6X8_9ZZZZ
MANILVVDDSKFMRKMLSDLLVTEEHRIVGEAENAMEATELYKQLKPDIVTLDIIMPEVGGTDAISALKEMVQMDPPAKVVVVSALGQQEVVDQFLEAGAMEYIAKPFQLCYITDAVERVLQSS